MNAVKHAQRDTMCDRFAARSFDTIRHNIYTVYTTRLYHDVVAPRHPVLIHVQSTQCIHQKRAIVFTM